MRRAGSWRRITLGVFPIIGLAAITLLSANVLRIVDAYPRDPGGDSVVYWILLGLAVSSFLVYWPRPRTIREALHGIRPASMTQRFIGNLLPRVPGAWAGLLFFAVALAWTLLNYRVDGFYATPDTDSYASVGQAALTSPAFWASERPFTLPLAFRVFGMTVQVLNSPSAFPTHARLFTQFESALSVASFVILGLAVASHVKSRALKSCALFLVVAFGMTIDVALWNRMLLSESLSASLLCLLAALGLVAVHVWQQWDRLSRAWRTAPFLALGLVAALYSFTRDVNAYLLLVVSAALAVSLVSGRVRRHPAVRAHVVLMGFLFLVFLLQYGSMSAGGRWVVPLANVLHERFLTSQDGRSLLAAAGLPIKDLPEGLISGQCGEDCDEFHLLLSSDPGGRLLMDWIRLRGKGVYLRYLVGHPVGALTGPLRDLDELLNGDSTEYRNRVYSDPLSALRLRPILFPRSTPLILLWALVVIVQLVMMAFAGTPRIYGLIPLLLILAAYPLMFVVWHGDAVELERHATQIGIQVRLALWMGSVFGLDCLWTRGFARRKVMESSDTVLPRQ